MGGLKRILVVDRNYPSEINLYADGFVHSRVKAYAAHCEVTVASIPNAGPDYEYEGISVRAFADLARLHAFIAQYKPDVIALHFAEGLLVDLLLATDVPFVVWVHGYEAMGFYRNLFGVTGARATASYAYTATRRLLRFRHLLTTCRKSGRGAFVVPSRWLKGVLRTDMLTPLPRTYVIPNPIDGALFAYRAKAPELRTKVLLLRSFDTTKYGTDIAADAIVALAEHRAFGDFSFTLCGRGRLFPAFAARLARYPNVRLIESYFPQREIPELHARHGVMLCPTRQDTHGVSMCEAMSSGLVPITTAVSAIPEFVRDGVNGRLTRNTREIVSALLDLHDNADRFARLSAAAAHDVRRICGLPGIIDRELELLERTARAS